MGEEHFAHIPLESEPSIAWETREFQRMELRERKRKVCFLSFLSFLLYCPFLSFLWHSSLLFLFSPITSGKLG